MRPQGDEAAGDALGNLISVDANED
jgi:hypothetical protein